MANQNKLKAYVRYDGTGRVIAGGPILQRFKPAVGNWVEIDANECCNSIPTTTTTTTQGGGGTPTAFIARIAGGVPEACGEQYGYVEVVYSASSTLDIGSYLYYDAALTEPLTGLQWVRVLNTTLVYTVFEGLITEVQDCYSGPVLQWLYSTIDNPQEVCSSTNILPFTFNGSSFCNSTVINLDTSNIGNGTLFYAAYQNNARLWVVINGTQATVWSANPNCVPINC